MKYTHLFEHIEYDDRALDFVEALVNTNTPTSLENTDDLLSIISDELSDNILIDGGHYPLEQKGYTIIHKPNHLTALVFEVAIKLFKTAQNQNIKASLGFLINDLGLDSEMRKNFKNEIILHPYYLELLKKNNLNINDITIIFFESNLRNRAARQILKNGIRSGLVKDYESILYIPDISDTNKAPDFGNYLGHKTGKLLIPFCRAIMAQKLTDSENLGYKKTINFLTEHEFKCLGEFAKVYHLFGGRNDVVNVLFSPLELTGKQNQFYCNSQCSCQSDVYLLKNLLNKFFVQVQKYMKN